MKEKSVQEYVDELRKMYRRSVPAVTEFIDEKPTEDALGGIIAVVTGGEGYRPIPNATVTITKSDTGEVIERVVTDQNGKTRIISLPAPNKDMSLTPSSNDEKVYQVYDMEVIAEGYLPSKIKNVPVFASTLSIQQFNLVWQYATDSMNTEIVDEGNPYNL
ncbi:MAG: carboxypeptidase-like regulatory domain-containing protein [Acutalibacteraceae bacterium]|nr:carboxypeptidase-like regulatory domain-containing protein [Acutalibacteraceae bacterium]